MTRARSGDRNPNWRWVGLGFLLITAGVAGVAFAWFPAPPHTTAAPLTGWPARWFAAGVGWFGLVVGAAGRGTPRGLRLGVVRGAFLLAVACWVAWLVSAALRLR